jgi:hypothetical protein
VSAVLPAASVSFFSPLSPSRARKQGDVQKEIDKELRDAHFFSTDEVSQ